MPWLGDQYFQAYPGEADWQEADGRWVNAMHVFRDVDHFGRCSLRMDDYMGFCISHWMPTPAKPQIKPGPKLGSALSMKELKNG